jgi:hypothetical protein
MLKSTITMEVEKNEKIEEHRQMCSQEPKITQSKKCFHLKLRKKQKSKKLRLELRSRDLEEEE